MKKTRKKTPSHEFVEKIAQRHVRGLVKAARKIDDIETEWAFWKAVQREVESELETLRSDRDARGEPDFEDC